MTEVLVAYATKMASTKEIAEAIADRIRSAGHRVAVHDAAEVRSVVPYRAVVLGSALYAGRWRRPAVKLLQHNVGLLTRMPTWLFHSGPLGTDLAPRRAPGKVRALAARIGADDPVTFSGRLTPESAVGFLARRMAQGPMAGDFRDWDEINNWADTIAQQLVAAR